jgi:4-amino-4-deoxy-L-arabinose transferase-like glycosyltransferase
VSTSAHALPTGRSATAVDARARSLPRPELLALLALAAVLNLWALSRNGWANEYYSAAVRSMAGSWHAFLYGSFDAGGVMTVDKPPLALWVQALSVRMFGFNSLAILVPQALMGIATVGLTYDLTRRRFGRVAGFVAGLALATTPIAVAISRHNNPDALLVLCCAGALWCVVRGLEDGRTRWLLGAGACVGLGFEAKMAAALLIVPALAAAWLWVAPGEGEAALRGRLVALRQLVAGGAVMVVVGGAWPLLMALTPASDRPWISETADNSIWSLILGYNGLGRLSGQSGGPQVVGGGGGPGGGGGGGASALFGGDSGPLRLLNPALGGQAGWLLGVALVAGVAILVASRLRRTDARTGWLIAVGGSFATIAVAFSFAQGIFHPYYVSQLAPLTAALVGAGAVELLRGGRTARVLAAVAVGAGVVTELAILGENPGELGWLPVVLVAFGIAAVVALVLADRRLRMAALAAVMGALLIAPATWAAQTLGHATNGTFPAGGPTSAGMDMAGGGGGPGGAGGFRGPRGGGGGGGMLPPGGAPGTIPPGGAPGAAPGGRGLGGGGGGFGGTTDGLTRALSYAAQNGGGTVAVASQSGAAGSIIEKGAGVAAIGGFSGRETQVTTDWLAEAVRAGKIRWVLANGSGFGGRGDDRIGSSNVMADVQQSCAAVPSVSGLYDCGGDALGNRSGTTQAPLTTRS